ncbi:MAG: hypothetical protein JXX29_04765 [Deltaproteobacteria bacterium]|nr:hypothetical protein [Deltaproteobacteria bacterium]MBN2670958.1 hypothetical protein [Deltaproteobacteria bacterium]
MKPGVPISIFCLLLCTQPTLADEPDDEASAAFQEGIRLYEAGEYPQSATAFRRAHSLKANWRLLYNIGQAEAASKRPGIALQSFEEYLTTGGDDIPEQRRAEVMEEIRRLRELVGALEIEAPESAVVYIDDVERGTTPLPGSIMISAGATHRVRVVHSNKAILDRTVRLSGRQTKTLHVSEDGPEDDAASSTEAPSPSSDTEATVNEAAEPTPANPLPKSKLKPIGIAILSTGSVVLAAGIVTGGIALSKEKELNSMCNGSICYDTKAADTLNSRDRLAVATDILIPVGAVLATIGGILLIANAKKQSERAVRIQPATGSHFAGVALHGEFSL